MYDFPTCLAPWRMRGLWPGLFFQATSCSVIFLFIAKWINRDKINQKLWNNQDCSDFFTVFDSIRVLIRDLQIGVIIKNVNLAIAAGKPSWMTPLLHGRGVIGSRDHIRRLREGVVELIVGIVHHFFPYILFISAFSCRTRLSQSVCSIHSHVHQPYSLPWLCRLYCSAGRYALSYLYLINNELIR